ncbi:DcaP family trimeric outer membrane transporter [Porticoccus sp. W117]|uniref:DcaP family trimeric outer membrane transporter n=1 Tax=Porticoccus sp. W117 TaxID=3054777 RepID=UPI002598EF8F|nr:DcaP family trimeric outer membrane transporter [Porticoccus sp. W117]MDM3869926.1 DcaP family trimeric outer membrane transporter [Porticoccus sp. W117]
MKTNNKKKILISALAAPMVLCSATALGDDNSQLLEKLKLLEQELSAVKSALAKQGEEQKKQAAAVQAAVAKSENKSGTSFNYGGFIKSDFMYSNYSGGERANAGIGDEILVPSVIPVGGSNGASRLDSHIKTSRFWFKTSTDTAAGAIDSHIELDFLTAEGNERISNSAGARVRHAYLNWHYAEDASLLVGQTWSTLMTPGALPEAVDFIGPTSGVIFNRQSQIRWTKKLAAGGAVKVALENPSSSVLDAGGGISGANFDDSTLPDLVVRYDGKAGNLTYGLALLGTEVGFDNGVTSAEDFGVGFSLAGKYLFANGDDLKFQFNHGPLGRFLALQPFRAAASETGGDISTIDQTGGYVAYRHKWNDKLRSTFMYAMADTDIPAGASLANTESVSNYNVNLIYSPTPKLSFGVEYIDAERELANGQSGDLKRLQFMGKYAF